MLPKRQPREEGEGDSGNQNKRMLISSSLYKVVRNVRNMQEFVPVLEPLIRKWVQEEVCDAVDRVLRSSSNGVRSSSSGIGYSCSRSLQLQFCSNLPRTLYTGGKAVSEDGSPIKLILYDSISKEVVRSGPFSSAKVNIVALDGDFVPDDHEGWLKEDFDLNIVKCRAGKKPLLTGDLTVLLKHGEGHIGQVIFNDNSSWTRSRKFRLGANINGEKSIREAMSNRFQIKDHRGELYEKHHPPSLHDEVWRLENIGKDGVFHKKLTDAGICCVRDFLRRYETSPDNLRSVLVNISKNTWDKIIRHATSCKLDDKRYMYTAALGIELFFNSIWKVVGVRFDGQGYQSVDTLDMAQMRMVKAMKEHAYQNMKDWVLVRDSPYNNYPTFPLNLTDNFCHTTFGLLEKYIHVEQGQPEMPMNEYQPAVSSPYYDEEVGRPHGCFETGESSQMQGFNPVYRNSFGIGAFSPEMFYGHAGTPGDIYFAPTLPAENLPVNDHFGDEPSSAWQGNGLSAPDSDNHEIGIACLNYGIAIPRADPKNNMVQIAISGVANPG